VNAPKDRLTVPDAAKLLGVTPEAIRQRIRRGTIEHEQDENGRYYVYTSSTEAVENNIGNNVQNDSQALHDHIETLKRELELRNEELRRKDHLLAAALERIPAIESGPDPPPEATESRMTTSEGADRGEGGDDPQKTLERRSWLYRFFFGT
jgi:DNA-binding transcriptional MerR regulator